MSGERGATRPVASAPGTPGATPVPAGSGDRTPPEIDSQALLQGQSILLIRHHDEVYRLQQTRQGKLILTK
jgi:hemin uptake protein HemP